MDESIWDLFHTFEKSDTVDDSLPVSRLGSDRCEACGSTDIRLVDGDFCCSMCSVVFSHFIDSNAEWRMFSDSGKGDPSRCGVPTSTLLPDAFNGTMISVKFGESWMMRQVRRNSFWSSISYKNRSLYSTFDKISQNAGASGISTTIIEDAKVLYKRLIDSGQVTGDCKTGLIASSIYMSCKSAHVPRSAREIAAVMGVDVPVITRGCKKFQNIMRVSVDLTTPADFINRFGSRLGIDAQSRDSCRHVISRCDELCLALNSIPTTIVAASLYLCSVVMGMHLSKSSVATVCGVSVLTMNKCYKRLYDARLYLFVDADIVKYNMA